MRKIILTIVAFNLLGCANMVTPSGGKIDDKIPVLIKTNLNPINFNENEIILTFDENVQIENVLKTFSIQPKHTTFTVKGTNRIIKIKLDSNLKENTTYILDINHGIKDVNEGNPYSMNYLFSTGNTIDTNYVEYSINNFETYKNLKIGLSRQEFDSLQTLKFEYLYTLNSSLNIIKGLKENIPYKSWIFTDKNDDNIPDKYFPIYYDTVLLNASKKIEMNQWLDFRNNKIKKYNKYNKIYKSINDPNTYENNNAIYIDKDSALFLAPNGDSFPPLNITKELQQNIKSKIRCIKTAKEYLIIIDKCGIKNLNLSDKLNHQEDDLYIQINSKKLIDSINLKIALNNDTISVNESKLIYEELKTISTLKILKNEKSSDIIIAIYEMDKLKIINTINRKKDIVFYLNPGNYKIKIYDTNKFKNISFNLEKLQRIGCRVLQYDINLKPNWDEVLQIKF